MRSIAIAIAATAALGACKPGASRTPTMSATEVIDAIRDFADRGCACFTDKECFREVRDEWETNRRDIVFNADLLKGDDRAAYDAERQRFGLCGDGAGLAVFDKH